MLDISDDAGFDDFEIIVTGTMADIAGGGLHLLGGMVHHHTERLKISRYERAKASNRKR